MDNYTYEPMLLNKQAIKDVRSKRATFSYKGKTYRSLKIMRGDSIEAGMLLFEYHRSYAHLINVKGFAVNNGYNVDRVQYTTVKQALAAYDVHNLADLEFKLREKGKALYMIMDCSEYDDGPWHFVLELGRWSTIVYGEVVSFLLIEEVL